MPKKPRLLAKQFIWLANSWNAGVLLSLPKGLWYLCASQRAKWSPRPQAVGQGNTAAEKRELGKRICQKKKDMIVGKVW